jgi:flavin-dependent dehydrogenase
MSGAVAVIGAGPAGLAAALALRGRGVPVQVFERAPGRPARLPETLYDAARSELDRLGVAPPPASASAVRFVSADGAVSVRMEVEAPVRLPTINRAELDVGLREAAAAAGARLRTGQAILGIEPAQGGGWVLSGPDDMRESFAQVIDATGKAALASGTSLAAVAEPYPLDARSSVFTHFERAEPFGVDAVTLVAAPQGFFYLVPLTPHRLCVGCVSYAADVPDEAKFQAAVAASPPVRALVLGANRALPLLAAKNAETRIGSVAVPGLFAAGDALGFRDPFLWDGIGYALGSGRQAGELAAAVALGQLTAEDAAAAYSASLQRIERRSTVEAETALAAFSAALAPVMLLDPHMPPPLLAALLGLARQDAEAGPRLALRRRRGDPSRRAAA